MGEGDMQTSCAKLSGLKQGYGMGGPDLGPAFSPWGWMELHILYIVFSEYNGFKVHSCCSVYSYSFSFQLPSNIPHISYHILSIHSQADDQHKVVSSLGIL